MSVSFEQLVDDGLVDCCAGCGIGSSNTLSGGKALNARVYSEGRRRSDASGQIVGRSSCCSGSKSCRGGGEGASAEGSSQNLGHVYGGEISCLDVVDTDGELESGGEGSTGEVELDKEVISGATNVLLGGSDSHKITVDVDGEQIVADVAVSD